MKEKNGPTMGTQRNGITKESLILSVDVGTTSIRCHVYDKTAHVRGSATAELVPLYPTTGHVELDPDALWKGFTSVVKGAVQDAGVQMGQMKALGISTQRATFTTWDRRTGVPFHNFITWQDQRAADLVKSWNRSCTMKVSQAVDEGNCCFGTIDTWLLFKLTKGRTHATDYSNASSTGIFNAYQMCWSQSLCSLVSLPLSIFPKVENTDHEFGSTDPSIFGVSIPIMSVMADQQAAMFGECCYNVGDVKITMGTGTFMDINTGSRPHTSITGLYPLVGWKIGSELVYLAEGNAADTGTAIRWAQALDLFSDVKDTSTMAYSVNDSDGVCFIPSFSGLQAPLNDPKACASFMGLKLSTTKCHLVRAILESVAFRNKQLYETMLAETNIPITRIRVDGGVSSNDFIVQLTADLFGRKVARCQHREMSCLGAAFVAGLAVGYWKTREELKKLHSAGDVFCPKGAASQYTPILQSWERALRRSMYWYKQP
ncbi:glycerol kinase 5 isoform X2 [Nerophis lumbriciformis]|uniref:glycerol kinase 5 isoform X2 n=1 Tax=Nerophis lumbriciformis TaxID=546530 RepID=UPI003BAD4AE2